MIFQQPLEDHAPTEKLAMLQEQTANPSWKRGNSIKRFPLITLYCHLEK
jgi:hypothetical protein